MKLIQIMFFLLLVRPQGSDAMRIFRIFIFILFVCSLSSSVLAIDRNGAALGVPSAGTVVVAAMESVGYHAQNQILTSLNTMMGDLGAFIYLCVILSAVLTVALMGRYQAALWLLIGPPIFIFVSGVELGGQVNRINARGPDWQMGAFHGPEGVKEQVMGRQDAPVDVSFVFHKYNELISEVYQLLINKITSADAKKSILFMARQRILEDIFSFDLTNPNGKALGAYFFGHCSNYISYARALGKGKRDKNYRQTGAYQSAKKEYCEGFNVKSINLGNESVTIAEYAKDLDPPYEMGQNVSCLQIWNWFRQSASKDFASQAERMMNTVIGVEANTVEGAASANKAKNDVLTKITSEGQSEIDAEGKDPCPFPSNSAKSAVLNSDAFQVLANIFSGLMIRKNNTIDANASGFMSMLGGDMSNISPGSDGSSRRQVASLQGRESILRSQNAQTMAVARQFEAFNLLMLVPYFQGMILYALSVTYPFFALTILVPGQAGSFFNWLALWAWAKSWDVGFAMIMVIDQLLWEILPKSTFFETSAIGEYTPIDLLEMHYTGDYAYSVSMYWLIVSALIGAVPIITAEAILGSKKAFAGALMGGFSDIGSRMGKAAEDYHSTKNVSAIVRARSQGEAFALRENADKARGAFNQLDKNAPNASANDAYRHNVNQLGGTADSIVRGAQATLGLEPTGTGGKNEGERLEDTGKAASDAAEAERAAAQGQGEQPPGSDK